MSAGTEIPVDLGQGLRWAAATLAGAGVAAAESEARTLLAHALGISVSDLLREASLGRGRTPSQILPLLERRCSREPLQHITGTAPFRHLDLRVGPGVFVPRPETEQVAQVAIDAAREREPEPIVVDLCAGSGAIALSVAREVPGSRVWAVELDSRSLEWTRLNCGAEVSVVQADAAAALPGLDGAVDVVVSNPPYIPRSEPPRDLEVRGYDPEIALYGDGSDGLDQVRAVVLRARGLLGSGGFLVVEHGDDQGPACRSIVESCGGFAAIGTGQDFTGRDRWVYATRRYDPKSPM